MHAFLWRPPGQAAHLSFHASHGFKATMQNGSTDTHGTETIAERSPASAFDAACLGVCLKMGPCVEVLSEQFRFYFKKKRSSPVIR